MPDPALILISGPPAAGKTTLSRSLAARFSLPLISKDGIKEILFDSLGSHTTEESQILGRASVALLFDIVERLLAAGLTVIAESAFYPDSDSVRIEELARKHSCQLLQVYCTADANVLIDRFEDRDCSGERHPSHVDFSRRAEIRRMFAEGFWKPLDIPGRTVTVDTTNFLGIDHEPVYVAIRAAMLAH